MVVELASPLLRSLLLGSLYALMALGLTMTYKVTRVPNFAHAEMLTVGAYLTVVFVNVLGRGPFEAVVVAFGATAALAVATDEAVYKQLSRKGATPLHLLVASIGVGLVIRYVLSIFADIYDLLSVKANVSVEPVAYIGSGTLTTLHLMVLPTAAAVVVILHLLLTATKLGKAMRATASNFDLARTSGINTALTRRVTWVIAGGLAGVAGAFWAFYVNVSPEAGWRALLWIFAASILGGFTSFYGTILGGYIVGFGENVGIAVMNSWFGIEIAFKPLIALSIIVAVFLLRPTGFAGVTLSGVREGMSRLIRRARSHVRQSR